MPAGAFLLMWDTLTAGRPFCAYVDNLAADGSCYTVFATITPLGDRYLSVRFRPLRTDLHSRRDYRAHDVAATVVCVAFHATDSVNFYFLVCHILQDCQP